MATPTSVLTADLHSAQRAWIKHPTLEGDAYYGFQQIVDYCTANELELVIAGDIFDKTRPDPLTIYHMRKQLERMERQNLSVYYNQGQHEFDRNKTWMESVSWWPEHIHRKVFQLGDIVAYGIDWTASTSIQEEFDRVLLDTQLLVMHQVWRDLMGPRIGDAECSFSEVPYADILLTGDFHQSLSLTTMNKSKKDMLVLSPGPVCMQSIDENPTKQFFVLCDDMTVQQILLKTRYCYRVTINNKDELNYFLDQYIHIATKPQIDVPDNISKNILHILYRDDIPEIYTRLVAAVGNKVHLFLKPIRSKQEIVTIETERRRALADGGLESCLELVVQPDSRIYKDLRNLLRSNTPQDQLVNIRDSFFKQHGTQQ